MTDPNFPLYQPPAAKPKEPPRAVKIIIVAVIGLGLLTMITAYAALFVVGEVTPTAHPSVAGSSATPSAREQGTATTYASVVELRDAAVAAGYPCPAWEVYPSGDGPKFAKEAGQCSDDDVFSIYADVDEVSKQLDLVAPTSDTNLLVGLNWMINIPESQRAKVQAKMGGEYVGLGDDEPSETEMSASDTAEGNIDKSDIKLRVKTLSKKCYGYGVGCNVEYRVVVDGAYMDDWPDEGEVEVSYTVRGPEDGPESNSFVITLDDGQYEKPWQEATSTRSRSAKLTVKVTDVEYSEG